MNAAEADHIIGAIGGCIAAIVAIYNAWLTRRVKRDTAEIERQLKEATRLGVIEGKRLSRLIDESPDAT